ncbi:hypothetical protein P9112_007194 [Eukaryota sp. TZLM1-RC]
MDPSSNPWQYITSSTVVGARRGASFVSDAASNLYLAFGSDNLRKDCSDLFKLSFDTYPPEFQRLQTSGTPPPARSFQSAAILEDNLYVFGGESDSVSLGDFYKLNLKTFQWSLIESSPSPSPRFASSLCVYGSTCLILYGGAVRLPEPDRDKTGYPIHYLNDLWVYNVPLDSWTRVEIPEPYAGTYGHSLTVVGDSLFVFGGFNEKGRNDQLFEIRFDLASSFDSTCSVVSRAFLNPISPVSLRPSPRHFHLAFSFEAGNKALLGIFGGTGGQSGSESNDFWIYDPSCLRFQQLLLLIPPHELPSPRSQMCGIGRDSLLYVYGGAGSNQLWSLDLGKTIQNEGNVTVGKVGETSEEVLPSGRNPFFSTLLSSDRFVKVVQRISDDNMKARVSDFRSLLSKEEGYRKGMAKKVDAELTTLKTRIALQSDSVNQIEGQIRKMIDVVIDDFNKKVSDSEHKLYSSLSVTNSLVEETFDNLNQQFDRLDEGTNNSIKIISNSFKETIENHKSEIDCVISDLKMEIENWFGDASSQTLEKIDLITDDLRELDRRMEFVGAELASLYESTNSDLVSSINDLRNLVKTEKAELMDMIDSLKSFSAIFESIVANCLGHCQALGGQQEDLREDIEKQFHTMESKILHQAEEINKYNIQFEIIQTENSQLRNENVELSSRIQFLEEHFLKLEEKLNGHSALISDNKRELETSINQTRDDLTQNIDQVKNSQSELETSIDQTRDDLTQNIDQVKNSQSELETSINQTRDDLTQIIDQVKNSQSELETSINQTRDDLTQNIDQVKNSQSELETSINQTRDDLTQNIDQVKNSQSELETSIDQTRDDLTQNIDQVKNSQSELETSINQTRDDLTQNIDQVKNSQSELETSINQTRDDLTQNIDQVKNSQSELETSINQTRDDLTQNIDQVKNSQSELETSIDQTRDDLTQNIDQVKNSQSELETSINQTHDDLTQNIDQVKNSQSELETSINQTRDDLTQNIDQVKNSQSELETSINQTRDDLTQNIDQVKNSQSELETSINQTRDDLTQNIDQVKNSQSELETSINQTRDDLTQNIDQVKNSQSELETSIDQTRDDLTQNIDQVKNSQSELETSIDQTRDDLTQNIDQVKNSQSELETSINQTRDDLTQNIDQVKNSQSELETSINQTRDDLTQNIDQVKNSQSELETSINQTRDDLTQIIDQVKNSQSELETSINQTCDDLTQNIDQVKNSQSEFVEEINSQLEQISKKFEKRLVSVTNTIITDLQRKISRGDQKQIDKINYVEKSLQVCSADVTQLAKSISSLQGQLYSKITAVERVLTDSMAEIRSGAFEQNSSNEAISEVDSEILTPIKQSLMNSIKTTRENLLSSIKPLSPLQVDRTLDDLPSPVYGGGSD